LAVATLSIDELSAKVAGRYWSVFEEYSRLAAQRLELSLAASFGFWATIGLLICWSEYERTYGPSVQNGK
jgi:hypothetical protein